MHIINATHFATAWTLGKYPDGRSVIVLVIRATYHLPADEREPARLLEPQEPPVEADQFSGVPGVSAPVAECDFAPGKPRADVLLLGRAYAPRGRPAERFPVRLRVTSGPRVFVDKAFDAVGPREWEVGAFGTRPSVARPFVAQPVSYDVAWGGTDRTPADPAKHATFLANHVGRGYFMNPESKAFVGQPLPLTEEPGQPIASPRGSYRPMAFGPIGRAWEPRYKLAGTYDARWREEQFPLLPRDFDPAYYQMAPADQQCERFTGDELVELTNLTPAGLTRFRLPRLALPVTFYPTQAAGPPIETQAVCDTLILEPERVRYSLVLRAIQPLKRNVFEYAEALVGTMPRGWHTARKIGKTYVPKGRLPGRAGQPAAV